MEADSAMPSESTRGSGRIPFVGWMPVVLLLLYVLSTGPAVRLCEKTGIVSSQQLETFYAPLIFLCDHCAPAQDFFIWYIFGLWDNPFYPGPK
jgi:hypothetical protein